MPAFRARAAYLLVALKPAATMTMQMEHNEKYTVSDWLKIQTKEFDKERSIVLGMRYKTGVATPREDENMPLPGISKGWMSRSEKFLPSGVATVAPPPETAAVQVTAASPAHAGRPAVPPIRGAGAQVAIAATPSQGGRSPGVAVPARRALPLVTEAEPPAAPMTRPSSMPRLRGTTIQWADAFAVKDPPKGFQGCRRSGISIF
uniref:Uncharacterized protein n=1 Tax=Zooxanthella nutricula TaxID=1333877 RepID=A0A7S2KNC6_9DINO